MQSVSRRATRLLACGVVAVSTGHQAAIAQIVVVTGKRIPCCGISMSFDQFMSNFAGWSSSSSFSVPEAEAFMVAGWGDWLKRETLPKAAMTISVCAISQASPASRAITRDSLDLERRAAANQMLFAALPNFLNTQSDGLIVAVQFTDGTQQQYRHTSFSGLVEMPRTYIPGNGIAGSTCTG